MQRVSHPFLADSERRWLSNSLGRAGIGGDAAFAGFGGFGCRPRLLRRCGREDSICDVRQRVSRIKVENFKENVGAQTKPNSKCRHLSKLPPQLR